MSTTTSTNLTSTTNPSLTPYTTTPTSYLTANPTITHLVVGALILHNNNRVLLIQRAPRDGFGLKWECPGGCVDTTADPSIVHALVREVREETGLEVEGCVRGVVDALEFEGGKGSRWRKITFLVVLDGHCEGKGEDGRELPPVVRLSEEEHVGAVWAGEGDVVDGRVGGREIQFAYDAQRETILEVFRKVRDGGGSGTE
ncbi:NUDIX hydrolase domain-like protein [Chaetomium fimeti]|uniref:NUDIX hydrolase domain-like protein n=1 Tax=Chaetomium fimeti TaxID=1854472 RepID=A0AAE0H701_9PEZI|nr:NUDIX hydrolase domain-like protein [Chaetomium fimeti]